MALNQCINWLLLLELLYSEPYEDPVAMVMAIYSVILVLVLNCFKNMYLVSTSIVLSVEVSLSGSWSWYQ